MPMNTSDMVSVMLAKENGKNIQMRSFDSNNVNDWKLEHSPSWDWENFQYRVFINNIDSSYYEYRKDNTWVMTTQRYPDYLMAELADKEHYDEYKRVEALGIRTIEDTRDIN